LSPPQPPRLETWRKRLGGDSPITIGRASGRDLETGRLSLPYLERWTQSSYDFDSHRLTMEAFMRGRFRAADLTLGIRTLMVGLAAGLGGCGNDFFAPPPPEGLREALAPAPPQGTTTPAAQTGAKPVELILAPRDPEAAVGSAHFARTQAGYDGVLIHPVAPTAETTPAGQADLVAAAIKEKPPVLIVEPPEKPDPRLAKLIDQARSHEIPVVLIGPPLDGVPDAEPSKNPADAKAPLVRIHPEPFQTTAKQLVQSALRVLKNAKLDPKGGAALYISPTSDPYMAARASAIRAALTEAGITDQLTVNCEPDATKALDNLKTTLKNNPKVNLLIPFDYRSYMAIHTVITGWEGDRTFVVSGYNSEERSPFLAQIKNMAAVAEFRPARLIRRAVQVARALMRKESVDPVIEISIRFADSPPSTGTPASKRAPKEADKAAETGGAKPVKKTDGEPKPKG
jgi:ABC-type sugar transport system substrate-binding protein